MDPSQMILPKGFVVNSQDIYKEVASYPVVPPEKIKEYWKVYTTTFRRLIDPTANRLEHFWWHVWGSDRRYLPGAVLAKLFEEISTGPTIAPIPGPPNRWEPPVFGDQPPPWELKRQAEESGVAEATNATKNTDPQGDSGPDVPEASKTATNENTIPTVGSISSKPAPAPPHPILKKSRGDSKSGPRPTARFIFPDEDDSKDDGEASSGSVSTANTEQRKSSSPAKSDRKKTSAPAKRFHASIGSKRRPALPRRISSQSSATSEPATREDGGSRHQAGLRLSQPAVESSGGSVSSNASTASQRSGLSAKVAGKRPALKKSTSNRAPGGLEAAQPTSPLHETTRKSALRDRIVEEPSGGPGDTAGLSKLDRTKSTEFSPIGAKTRPRIPRSQSHIEPQRFGMGMGRSLRPTLAAEPTASTTNVAALGTIIDFDKSEMPRLSGSMQPNAERDGYRLPRGPSTTSLLDSRFTPTPPSATPEVPLGRTKSQLTLLLEREKSRLGDKPRSKH